MSICRDFFFSLPASVTFLLSQLYDSMGCTYFNTILLRILEK